MKRLALWTALVAVVSLTGCESTQHRRASGKPARFFDQSDWPDHVARKPSVFRAIFLDPYPCSTPAYAGTYIPVYPGW